MAGDLQSAYQKGIRWSFAGSMGSALFQFGQMAVFARLSGPEASGDYALAATVVGFLTPVAEAGISQAVVQAAQVHPRQLAALTWVNVALGIFIFLMLCLAGPAISKWYGRPALPGLLLLMGTALLITPFGATYAGLLTREMQFNAAAKIEVGAWAISFVGVVWLAVLGWGPWAMAVGFLLRNLAGTLGAIWLGRRLNPANLFQGNSPIEIMPMLRFGFYELGSRWADYLSNYLDKLIVGKWLGVTALGYYNLAFTFLMLPTARLGYIFTRVTFPLIAKVRKDPVQLQWYFEQPSRQIILVLFPFYIGMVLFSRELLEFFFGKMWLPAAPLFVAFGWAGLVRSVCSPFPQLLKGLGKPQIWLVWMLVYTAFLNATLAFFLWMEPTPESAAWSRTATKFLFEIALLGWLARYCAVAFAPVLRFALKVLLCLLPALVLTWLVGYLSVNFWINVGLKTLVFSASVWGMYWWGPLRREVRELMDHFSISRQASGK